MRILTYKRTHVGDPNRFGYFGVHDCMGGVRDFLYDAVIGVGGIGEEPRSFGIDGRINWVGIGPKRTIRPPGYRASIVEFEHFILLDRTGPELARVAPHLAKKIYGGRRYILDAYTNVEQAEALHIVEWAKEHARKTEAQQRRPHPPIRALSIARQAVRKCSTATLRQIQVEGSAG